MRPYRADIQMVFQDPYSSLNPRQTVEPDRRRAADDPHDAIDGASGGARRAGCCEKVGLSPEQVNRYPHEFSGGQRQRIGIARALATNPKIVIADEPVSALDVSVQAQVINLMQDLQEEFGLSYLFIAHDLSVVRHISDRDRRDVPGQHRRDGRRPTRSTSVPMHPYSRALLARGAAARSRGAPHSTRAARRRHPVADAQAVGCAFRTRCPIARPACAEAVPPLTLRDGRLVACPYSE